MDLKSWQVEYEWHYLMQYGAAEEKIRKNSDWTLKNIPSGCSRGIRADWHYYDHDSLEKGIRANLFVFPTRYQESIQDAYFGSFGYILNSNPKIRKHLKNMELVTEFNRDYIKKGLTNKFVDLIGKKLEQDIKTKGGRNFTKKVIAAGLIGVISLGYFGVKKIKGTINNQPPNQKLERVFNLDKEIK